MLKCKKHRSLELQLRGVVLHNEKNNITPSKSKSRHPYFIEKLHKSWHFLRSKSDPQTGESTPVKPCDVAMDLAERKFFGKNTEISTRIQIL
jgi:hypothetical protein